MASLLVAILSSVRYACIDVPTPYPELPDASRLAICTVGHRPSIINT